MAGQKSWRDYSKNHTAKKEEEESAESKKTGTWRDYTSSNSSSEKKTPSLGSWRDYDKDNTDRIGESITNRVNNWLKNHNNFISNYQTRTSDRKYSYEDDYVSDSASWLDTVTKQKEIFDTEADSILSYIDQYGGALDANWVNDIKTTLSSARKNQSAILDRYTKDNEYWSSFGTEEMVSQYGSAEEAYKTMQRYDGYSKKYTGQDYDVIQEALSTLEEGEEKDWLTSYTVSARNEAQKTFDTVAGAKEIEELEDVLQAVNEAGSQYGMGGNDSAILAEMQRILEAHGYSNKAELENLISKKKAFLNQAKYTQEGIKLAGVADKTSDYYDPEFSKYTGYVDDGKTSLIPDYKDVIYDVVNNNGDTGKIATGQAWKRITGQEKKRLDTVKHMNADERAIYNYYYSKHGYDAAEEYLDSIIETINGRIAQQNVANLEGKWLLEELYGINAGLDQFNSGISNFFNTEDAYIPVSAAQQTSALVREDLGDVGFQLPEWLGGGSLGQGIYDLTTTTANMAPSILLSTAVGAINPAAGAVVGSGLMGVSAAGNAYADAINRGFDKSEARAYSTAIGVAESCLQYALGGISKLGGISSKMANAVSGIDNALLRFCAKYGSSIASEGFEEGLQEVLDPLLQNAILHADEDIDWSQVAYSALLGGLSAGTLELGGTINETRAESKLNKNALAQYGDQTDALIQEGLESDVKNDSYKLAQKYQQQVQGKDGKSGKALTGAQIRNLLAANQEQITPKDLKKIQTAAEERLTELGETGNVSEIAELATKFATGQKLSRAEKSTLAHSAYGARVSNELLPSNIASEDYSTAWAEDIGTQKVNAAAYNKQKIRTLIESIGSTEDPAVYKPVTDRVGEEAQYKTAKSGKITLRESNEAVKIAEVAAIKDGHMTVKLEDGREVSAEDIDFADDNEAILYSAIANVENITPGAATALVKGYDASSGMSVQEYVNGIDEAYTYGFHGYTEADVATGTFTPSLTAQQKTDAYMLGQSAKKISRDAAAIEHKRMRTAIEAEAAKQAEATKERIKANTKELNVWFEDGGKVVKFDEAGHKYDDQRMAGVKGAQFLQRLGIGGNNVYFYESYQGADGEFYRKDANGVEVVAENGWIDSNGDIHIDINAGADGRGVTLYTLGHELTHFIEVNSKEKYQALVDMVTEAYAKTDVTMHSRVLAKQKFLEAKRGKTVSYSEAHSEVMADALSTMLADGNLAERLAEIRAKDKGLHRLIKRFINKVIAKFRKAYAELTPDQQDAQDIRQMKEVFDNLQAAFAEALVDASDSFRAGESFQASEQVLEESGIAVNPETESGSLLSVRDVLNDKDRKNVAKALAERFNVTEKEAMYWLKAETSLASIILNPKYSAFLDYEGDPNEVAIKQNSDYPQGTVDFSNICKKRREFTQVMNRILRNFPNHVFAATDLAKIRTIMGEEGMTLPCGICYVEDRRQLDSIVAQDFIDGLKLYREGSKTRPDGKPFNANQLKGLQLTDGDAYVPSIYELVTLEGRNSLKEKNPNMEAAWVKYNNARGMQAVRLLTNEAEYKRQILKYSPKTVKTKNDYGGLRIYSFSDAEMFHLIDIVQVLTDCATVGLKVQGYTKVNEYAKAVKDTGEKLNRSLIPLGDLGYHMENGKVVLDYDPVEGIDIHSKDFFDSKDNPNVGNIVIGINPTQIRAAMVSDFIDYIIPFHTGQSAEVLGEKGIAAWFNYRDSQSETELATGKKSAHQINIYTEVFQAAEDEGKPIRNKRDFVDKFLAVCKENGLKPRFAEFLNMDANGDYVYTEGYHKFLVDFKTFAQTEVGEYLPQMPVKPVFDDAYLTGLLEAYVKEQQVKDAEVAKQMPKVIDRITNEIVKPSDKKGYNQGADAGEVKYSTREAFYTEYDAWDKKDTNRTFVVGTTSDALQSVGMKDQNIVLRSGTVLQKINDHPEMTFDIFKGIPELLEYPVIVQFSDAIDSKTKRPKYDSSITVLGELYADVKEDGKTVKKPVLVSIELLPTNQKKTAVLDFAIIKSAYSKNALQQYLNENSILYIDPDKKRTDSWLSLNRLQLPLGENRYGPIRKIAYVEGKVKVQNSKNMTAIEKALFDAGVIDEFGQKRNSERGDGTSNRDLLANAFEGIAKSSPEYKLIQEYKGRIRIINEYEEDLAKINAEIRKLTFGTEGQRDTQRLKQLQAEAKKLAESINRNDKKLLSLEASEPLRKVIERERKKEAQKTKDHVKEIREKMKETAAVKEKRTVVEKAAKALMDMLAHPTKDAHVPTALQKPLQEFLESIDFSSQTQLAGKGMTIRDVAYTRALAEVRAAIAGQRSAMDGAEDGIFELDIPDSFLKEIDDHIRVINSATKGLDLTTNRVYEMNSDELADLGYMLKTINRAIRHIDKLHMAGAKARVSQLGQDTRLEMSRRKPVKDESGGKAMWANYTPWHAFRRMGKAAQQIFKGLMQGQSKLARTIASVIQFAEKTYTAKEAKAWEHKKHTIKLDSGKTITMTPAQIMSFYCLSKRQHAKGHMMGGGIRISTIKNDIKDSVQEHAKELVQKEHYTLTEKDIANIISHLTDRQIAVAEALQQYMQNVGGRLNNEISMARWDYMAATEENYFPIKTDDSTRDVKDPGQEKSNLWALLNKSFTKGLTPGANNAMVVESIFDVFADHMSEVAEYNAFALPLVDAMKWFNYRERIKLDDTHIKDVSVQKSIRDALGTSAVKYFVDLMTDINSSQKAGRHENLAGQILSRSKVASVGWNLRVAIQQPTAILRASLILDMPSLLKGTVRIGTKELVKEMQQYSGIALWKSMGYYDLNVSRSVREQIKGDDGLIDKLNELGMWLPGKMDEITWARIWAATKAKIAKEQKLSGEELLQATAELFEEVVYQTQVADSVLTRSSMMRSKTQFMKEATSFMAEPTASVNILLSAFQDYEEGHTNWDKAKRGLAIGFYGYALSAIANAIATSLMDAWRDDDEHEEYWEKFMQALLGEKNFLDGNLFSELNPLEKVVFVKDFISLLKGYDVAPGYADLFKSGIDLVTNFKNFLEGRGSITTYGIIYQALQVLGNVLGFGASNIAREVAGVWNNTIAKLYPDLLLHRYDAGAKNEIRNAYATGALTPQEAMQLLTDNGIVENENEAYWELQKWDSSSDYSKYGSLFKAVQNGQNIDEAMEELISHGHTEKDVRSQIKSKIGKWYQEKAITKQQAVDMLTEYSEMGEEESVSKVNYWSFLDEHPKYKDIYTESHVAKYHEFAKPAGISVDVYSQYIEGTKNLETIKDEWGDVEVTKREQVLEVIDSLPLTWEQKDALYLAAGYAEDKIWDVPW